MTAAFEPDLSVWEAWHPGEVARRLAAVDAPWYIAAGWALDLFRGRQTRDHEDLEIAVAAEDFDAFHRALEGFELFVVGGGVAQPLTPESLAEHHQTWVRDPATGHWRLDLMREPWEGNTWVCRRDSRISLPLSKAIACTAQGIPFGQPEIVLLFKAKEARPKDEADFMSALPLLDPAQRRWLAGALALAHQGHPWLRVLAAS